MIERQVWRIDKSGDLSRLRQISEQLEAPERDQVQIRVRTVGLNFADIFACLGLYSATPGGSFVPGLEIAGEIIATGSERPELQVGDRVMGMTRFGGYVSHLNSHPRYLVRLPESWSFASSRKAEPLYYLVQPHSQACQDYDTCPSYQWP